MSLLEYVLIEKFHVKKLFDVHEKRGIVVKISGHFLVKLYLRVKGERRNR